MPGHAGPKIMKGFVAAFRRMGHFVTDLGAKEPFLGAYDMIMGYSGQSVINMGEAGYNLAHFLNARLVQYWADDDEKLDSILREGVIFQSDKGCADKWNKCGIKNIYLPLCTDETLFFPMDLKKEYDVVITGLSSAPRLNALRQLEGLNVAIFGPWTGFWEECPEYHKYYKGCLATEAELNEVYNKSKICLDVSNPQNLNSANFTLFNAMASGCALVTNYKPALEDLFGDKQPPSFGDDCRSLIDKLLNDPELLNATAKQQRETIIGGHTFMHRAKQVLDIAEKSEPLALPEELARELKAFINTQSDGKN